MAKKYKLMALLLSVILVFGLVGCGGKSKKPNTKNDSAKQTASQDNKVDQAVQATPISIAENTEEKTDVVSNRAYLSPNEFGRENPFLPLGQFGKKSKIPEDKFALIAANEARLAPKNVPKTPIVKTEVLPSVALTLVIDSKTAIFQEANGSKVASVGDSVAGMKVVEIRNSEAVLDSGNDKYVLTLGGHIRKVSSQTTK